MSHQDHFSYLADTFNVAVQPISVQPNWQQRVLDSARMMGCSTQRALRYASAACANLRSISVGPVDDSESYYIALHEMGHVVLNHEGTEPAMRDGTILIVEAEANLWALEHAALPPTPEVWRTLKICYETYLMRCEPHTITTHPTIKRWLQVLRENVG